MQYVESMQNIQQKELKYKIKFFHHFELIDLFFQKYFLLKVIDNFLKLENQLLLRILKNLFDLLLNVLHIELKKNYYQILEREELKLKLI